jgi:hypothetical protein
MKILAFLATLGVLAISAEAQATQVGSSRLAGVGFSLGEPTGVVGKLFLGSENAVDAGVSLFGFSGYCKDKGSKKFDQCSGGTRIAVNMDYLWQYNLLPGDVRLDWHIGAGGRLWLWSGDSNSGNLAMAARMPIGLDLMPAKPDILEFFVELTPTFYLAPGQQLDLEGALGVRFYF